MKKKKKGSSLIVVVMIFGFLVVFAGGMLAMTAGEYKLRVSESKRVQNLYGAESGIDVEQNLIGKTFEAAVKYANIKVEQFKSENNDYIKNAAYKENTEKAIQLIKSNTSLKKSEKDAKIKDAEKELTKVNDLLKTSLNNEFKKQFNEFIKPVGDLNKSCNEDGKIDDELRRALAKNKYIQSFNDDGTVEFYKDVTFETADKPEIFYYKDKKINGDGKINYDGIEPIDKDSKSTSDSDKIVKYKIKITSEFKSSKSNVGANKRTVQTNFELIVPDYKDTKSSENKKVELKDYPAISQKLMTIDGNMNIDTITPDKNKPVNFYGNVHVTGNSSTAAGYGNSIAYTKYKGGVSINNSIVNFMKGYLATGETFNVQNNSEINADDIYARNVYMGVKDGQSVANSAEGQITRVNVTNSIFTDNDLAMKADKSTVSMNNFYGLNDKNVKANDSSEKDKTSSSILINGGKYSYLDVKKKAIIMGVGYINAGDGYMTGESTAVKGNYLAYADPTDYPDLDLKQYGNLQLIDDKKLDVFKKSEKFKKYWEAQKNADNGGISLPSDTIAIGAFFYKDGNQIKINTSTYSNDNKSEVDEQRKDYGSKIFRMGRGTVDEADYNNESGKWTVNNKVDFNTDTSGYNLIGQSSKKYKFIFNKDKNKSIVLRGSTQSSGEDIKENANEIDIYGNIVNAVIITNGNVKVEGDIKFTGNIIAAGDVSISDSGEKDFIYDQNVSDIIQSDNIAMVNEIFKKTATGTVSSYVNITESSEGDISQYNVSSYLKAKLWKIVI